MVLSLAVYANLIAIQLEAMDDTHRELVARGLNRILARSFHLFLSPTRQTVKHGTLGERVVVPSTKTLTCEVHVFGVIHVAVVDRRLGRTP